MDKITFLLDMCGSALLLASRREIAALSWDGVWEAFDCHDFKVNILQSFNPNIGCEKRLEPLEWSLPHTLLFHEKNRFLVKLLR